MLGLITHFYNEELLLPHWLEHHKFADEIILIDHHSTDNSLDIAEDFIIKNPNKKIKVIQTQMLDFNAIELDREVMEVETQLTTKYKMTLNTTEFLFISNLEKRLPSMIDGYDAIGVCSMVLVDKEELPIEFPIWVNRTWGYRDPGHVRRFRYIHKAKHGNYQVGRHGTNLSHIDNSDFLILWFGYSPWPQCKQRKLQIQNRIPQSDRQKGWGWEHLITEEQLDERHKEQLKMSYDLMLDKNYRECYHWFNGKY